MFRKTTAILFTILLCFSLMVSVSAQTTAIHDDAGLFTVEEVRSLEEKAAERKELYDVQAVILTVNSLNGFRAQDYADAYYEQAGYGDNGVLFLLAMAEREWYISTSGAVIYALTDYGIQKLGEGAVSYFAEELWYDGFSYFLDALPVYLESFEDGTPIDGYADYSGDYYHGDQEEILYYEEFTPSFLLSLLCSIVVSSIVILVMRLCMLTKRPQRCASAYIKEGSWKLTQHRDVFLYSNVTKVRKQEPPKNNGGGSSTHRSSSGSRHGGGGGKF